jgi:hypothetical protein
VTIGKRDQQQTPALIESSAHSFGFPVTTSDPVTDSEAFTLRSIGQHSIASTIG